jgi:hypothetical protein
MPFDDLWRSAEREFWLSTNPRYQIPKVHRARHGPKVPFPASTLPNGGGLISEAAVREGELTYHEMIAVSAAINSLLHHRAAFGGLDPR